MRIDGYGILTDRVTGRVLAEHDTKLCCHCGGQFQVVPGSGKTRGYCMACGDVTCGQQKCFEHAPFQRWLDSQEKPASRIFTG